MKQLLMYYTDREIKEPCVLPEGYSFSNYRDLISDRDAWVRICRDGLVGDGEEGYQAFDSSVLGVPDIIPFRDVYFLDYKGEHIGTFTAFVHSDDNTGDFHMVSIRTDFRGKGLSKYLCRKAIEIFTEKKVHHVHLTTDDFRLGAVKSYLNAGFKPVNWDDDMEERWRAVLGKIGVDSAELLNDDASFCKIIRRNKNIAVYLGSRSGNEPIYTDAIRELGAWIGGSGYTLVYGGSKTGLMGEVAKSTMEAGGKVIGIEAAMFYDRNFQADYLTELIVSKDMSERKNKMLEMGDVFIAFPGGTGTLDEVSEVFVALSLGTKKAKCILYNLGGYYEDLRKMLDKMVEKDFSTGEGFENIYFAKDLDEIRKIIGS